MPLKSLAPRLGIGLFCLAQSVLFSSVFAQSESRFDEVPSTPYDTQMQRVGMVLSTPLGWSDGPISAVTINKWMTELRAVPYRYSILWKTPAEVEAAQLADCKGKVLVLYERMRAQGATCLRLVIGKRSPDDAKTHAWLEWETKNGTFLLDPTFYETFTKVGTHAVSSYVPMYAYDYVRKYRAHDYQGDASEFVLAQNSSTSNVAAPSQGSALAPTGLAPNAAGDPLTVPAQSPCSIIPADETAIVLQEKHSTPPVENSLYKAAPDTDDLCWVTNAKRNLADAPNSVSDTHLWSAKAAKKSLHSKAQAFR